MAGLLREADANKLGFQLAAESSGQTNQPSSEQSECAGLGNGAADIGVAAGDRSASVKEAFARVDRQLDRGAIYSRAAAIPLARNGPRQRVIVCAVGQRNQCPANRTRKRPAEYRAARNAIGAVTGDGETSTAIEGAAHLQTSRGKRTRREAHAPEATCDQTSAAETVDRDEFRTG